MLINTCMIIIATTYFVCFFLLFRRFIKIILITQKKQWVQRHKSGKIEGIYVTVLEQKVISTNPRAIGALSKLLLSVVSNSDGVFSMENHVYK